MQSQDTERAGIDSQTSQSAGIVVENLTKEFDTQEGYELVFSDVSFEVESGSFVSLLGKSGSGKSTILNIISDLIQPTEGQVSFRLGDELYDRSSDEVTLGHVFQSPRLLPWNTVLENIEYVHENNPDYTPELGRQYLDLVGLSEHYDKYPTQLSGGQRQRVGIARAFSIDPDILVMDEPFSNLDEITAESLREELTNIWQEFQKTVLFVTHDITEAIELSDRILMLGEGRIYENLEVPLERPRDVDSNEFIEFRADAIRKFYAGIEDA